MGARGKRRPGSRVLTSDSLLPTRAALRRPRRTRSRRGPVASISPLASAGGRGWARRDRRRPRRTGQAVLHISIYARFVGGGKSMPGGNKQVRSRHLYFRQARILRQDPARALARPVPRLASAATRLGVVAVRGPRVPTRGGSWRTGRLGRGPGPGSREPAGLPACDSRCRCVAGRSRLAGGGSRMRPDLLVAETTVRTHVGRILTKTKPVAARPGPGRRPTKPASSGPATRRGLKAWSASGQPG
jgi:hypothetical protein